MPPQSLKRRLPLWVVCVLCGLWQVLPTTLPPALRPELVLVLLTYVALRGDAQRSGLLAAVLGWLVVACVPGHPLLLLGFWLLVGFGLGALRSQWYTERLPVYLVVAWLIVMAWHGLTWLVAWSDTAAPRRWSFSFLMGQTIVTLTVAWAWARWAPRWVDVHEAWHAT